MKKSFSTVKIHDELNNLFSQSLSRHYRSKRLFYTMWFVRARRREKNILVSNPLNMIYIIIIIAKEFHYKTQSDTP